MSASRRTPGLRVFSGALAATLLVALAGCSTGSSGSDSAGDSSSDAPSGSGSKAAQAASDVQVSSNVPDKASGVKVSRVVRLTAKDGTFRTVRVSTLKGAEVPGTMSADRTGWTASGRLDSGRSYVVKAVAADTDGKAKDYTANFSTATLSKAEQTYPSVSPLAGSTVGVGMPIMVSFDVPVKNRARFERHMKVTSSAGQVGSWYWIDDEHAHYRPETYWKAGSTINVALDLKSLDAGGGIYGQVDRSYSFNVSRSLVSKVDAKTDQMKVFKNGTLIRTIPITTGMPGFTTRSGTKVIVEKDRRHDMNSETIGLDPNGPNGYNLKGVEYAMRLTFSGEFIHAAPWSVASQGRANVSHGCTGMSTANAGWLFNESMIGDPVEYSGTDKQMTLTNGYGDWNLSWADWQKGSALASAGA